MSKETRFTSSIDPEARRDNETWPQTVMRMYRGHGIDHGNRAVPEPPVDPWGDEYEDTERKE